MAVLRRGKDRVGVRLQEARRTCRSIYTMEWRFAAPLSRSEHVLESVLDWCRETLGKTRRPWGIGQFDLAIAVNDGATPRSVKFVHLEPADAYHEGRLEERLQRFLAAEGVPETALLTVAVALFSWGDAVYSIV